MQVKTQDVDEIVVGNGGRVFSREDVLHLGRETLHKKAANKINGSAKQQMLIALTGEELGVEVSGQKADVPGDIKEQMQAWTDSYKSYLLEQTELYLERLSNNGRAQVEIGEPTVLNYPYWDLVTLSPLQFIFAPPFRPHKIVASGEFAVIWAVLFINPAPAPFGNPSATTVLGGRSFRIRFEQVNMTDVANGPDFTITGTFPPIAPTISLFPFPFTAPDPGINPRLLEVNVTADITNMAQPFAAFATHHVDFDSEPSFLGIPPVPPELQHDSPLRYLIYRK